MNFVVILILAIVWALFLIPQALRARAEHSPADSIGAFRRQLSVLERTAPAGPSRPEARLAPYAAAGPAPRARPVAPRMAPAERDALALSRSEARKRRRDILVGLLALMGTTLVLGLIPAFRVLLGLNLVLDVLFVAYVAMLIRARNAAAERELKVRFLPTSSPEPAFLLRRSAN